jgi:sulfur carrier protein
MKVQINGEAQEIGEGVTVAGLLVQRKVKMPDMVSVELNGDILDRDKFESTALKPGDAVELLYFMGGGRQTA